MFWSIASIPDMVAMVIPPGASAVSCAAEYWVMNM